jgi:hypothetical protein
MTSLYGTTQAYNGLANTYLYLAPSCDDKLFGTNINYCSLSQWGIYDGQEADPKVLNMYKAQTQACNNGLCSTALGDMLKDQQEKDAFTKSMSTITLNGSTQKSTVYSLLQRNPKLSKWRKIVERAGFVPYINSMNGNYRVTMFAPTDDQIPDEWMVKLPYMAPNTLRPLCLAHTLPFFFDQRDATGRKLKLYTSLTNPTYAVYIDGTGEVRNTLNFYVPPEEMLHVSYPQPMERIDLLQGWYGNNGALYEIGGMFSPSVVV